VVVTEAISWSSQLRVEFGRPVRRALFTVVVLAGTLCLSLLELDLVG